MGVVWPAVFLGPRQTFWRRMTLGVGALGLYSLAADPGLRRERPQWRDVAAGLGSAAALYRIFHLGDRLARRMLPAGEREIDAIYALRTKAPRWLIALALAGVIGPGEELFWRGLVQKGLERRLGRGGAAAATAALYGGIHVVSRNLTLTAAATVAGAFWGSLYARDRRLAALIVSHTAWDLWIFLVAPTTRSAS